MSIALIGRNEKIEPPFISAARLNVLKFSTELKSVSS